MEPGLIKNLGNWNIDTQEDRYSAKLPLKAMRIMAGQDPNRGNYFLPRSGLQPPEDLQRQIFPFVEKELESTKSPTAKAFLNLFKRLRIVITQDIAVLKHQGRKHFLFSLPIFETQSFIQFQQSLIGHIEASKLTINDRIDSVLPGIQELITNSHQNLKGDLSVLTAKLGNVSHQMSNVATRSHFQGFIYHISQFDLKKIQTDGQGNSTERVESPMLNESPLLKSVESDSGIIFYEMCKNHPSFRSIYNEWFGIGEFSCQISSNVPFGGIDALEKKTKGLWRKGWNTADQKRFSRTIWFLGELIKDGTPQEEAIDFLERVYQAKKSLSAVECYLKNQLKSQTKDFKVKMT